MSHHDNHISSSSCLRHVSQSTDSHRRRWSRSLLAWFLPRREASSIPISPMATRWAPILLHPSTRPSLHPSNHLAPSSTSLTFSHALPPLPLPTPPSPCLQNAPTNSLQTAASLIYPHKPLSPRYGTAMPRTMDARLLTPSWLPHAFGHRRGSLSLHAVRAQLGHLHLAMQRRGSVVPTERAQREVARGAPDRASPARRGAAS
jgi:hypothetical protein